MAERSEGLDAEGVWRKEAMEKGVREAEREWGREEKRLYPMHPPYPMFRCLRRGADGVVYGGKSRVYKARNIMAAVLEFEHDWGEYPNEVHLLVQVDGGRGVLEIGEAGYGENPFLAKGKGHVTWEEGRTVAQMAEDLQEQEQGWAHEREQNVEKWRLMQEKVDAAQAAVEAEEVKARALQYTVMTQKDHIRGLESRESRTVRRMELYRELYAKMRRYLEKLVMNTSIVTNEMDEKYKRLGAGVGGAGEMVGVDEIGKRLGERPKPKAPHEYLNDSEDALRHDEYDYEHADDADQDDNEW